MQIIVAEKRRAWYHFLTTTCAVVGGVFTVAGICDSLLHTSVRAACAPRPRQRLGCRAATVLMVCRTPQPVLHALPGECRSALLLCCSAWTVFMFMLMALHSLAPKHRECCLCAAKPVLVVAAGLLHAQVRAACSKQTSEHDVPRICNLHMTVDYNEL